MLLLLLLLLLLLCWPSSAAAVGLGLDSLCALTRHGLLVIMACVFLLLPHHHQQDCINVIRILLSASVPLRMPTYLTNPVL
jgi:hypothetical protein